MRISTSMNSALTQTSNVHAFHLATGSFMGQFWFVNDKLIRNNGRKVIYFTVAYELRYFVHSQRERYYWLFVALTIKREPDNLV